MATYPTISPEQQRLVIEKLYRSNDALGSTEKFNEQYRDTLGLVGESTMTLHEFSRLMKQTDFLSRDVEKFTSEVTGEQIDLETS